MNVIWTKKELVFGAFGYRYSPPSEKDGTGRCVFQSTISPGPRAPPATHIAAPPNAATWAGRPRSAIISGPLSQPRLGRSRSKYLEEGNDDISKSLKRNPMFQDIEQAKYDYGKASD